MKEVNETEQTKILFLNRHFPLAAETACSLSLKGKSLPCTLFQLLNYFAIFFWYLHLIWWSSKLKWNLFQATPCDYRYLVSCLSFNSNGKQQPIPHGPLSIRAPEARAAAGFECRWTAADYWLSLRTSEKFTELSSQKKLESNKDYVTLISPTPPTKKNPKNQKLKKVVTALLVFIGHKTSSC